MKRTPLKSHKPLKRKTPLKARKGLNKISIKQKAELTKLADLTQKLRRLCGNRSELNRRKPDWQSNYMAEPHHIGGRSGKHLLNPFEIIMLTREEHDIENGQRRGEKVGAARLKALIRPLRLKQGFKEEKRSE